jgi:hypothetical protein
MGAFKKGGYVKVMRRSVAFQNHKWYDLWERVRVSRMHYKLGLGWLLLSCIHADTKLCQTRNEEHQGPCFVPSRSLAI